MLVICRYRAGKTGIQPTIIPTACSATLRFLSALNCVEWGVEKLDTYAKRATFIKIIVRLGFLAWRICQTRRAILEATALVDRVSIHYICMIMREEARFLQHADCKYNRDSNLPPHWHLQVPDGNKWDSKHHEVRDNVDNRGGDEEGVGIDARFARDLYLVDTLKDHNENQGDAVKKIEPDHSP